MLVKGKQIGEGMPCICVPVLEKEKDAIVREIKFLSESKIDCIEWRVDAFEDFKNYNAIREIFDTIRPFVKEKIFLFTFRTKIQGGLAKADDAMLEDLHDLAAESGCVDFVDMEFFEEDHPLKKIRKLHEKGIKVIASHHDFEETPEREVMRMLLNKMCSGGADIVKLAMMPVCEEDVLDLLAVTCQFKKENPDTPIISMSMGKLGLVSRFCGESFGSCMSFASHRKKSAPGQFEMNDTYEILKIVHNRAEKCNG